MADSTQWRYCENCHGLFYNGFADNKGFCPGGTITEHPDGTSGLGGHVVNPRSFQFVLPSNVPGKSTLQRAWRLCRDCGLLFYSGFRKQGQCVTGGNHRPNDWEFLLPHDLSRNMRSRGLSHKFAQSAWRFCCNCYALFYDGYRKPGKCAAGGDHTAQGWDFELPHDLPPAIDASFPFQARSPISNVPVIGLFGAQVNGVAHVRLTQEGNYRWWGTVRNLSAVESNMVVVMMMKDSQNNLYPFIQPVHVSGFFEPNLRDAYWGTPPDEKPYRDPKVNLKDTWPFLASGWTADCVVCPSTDVANMLALLAAGLGIALAL